MCSHDGYPLRTRIEIVRQGIDEVGEGAYRAICPLHTGNAVRHGESLRRVVGQHGVLAGRQRVGNGVATFLAVGGRAVNLYRIGIFFLIISLRQVHRYGHYAFVGVWRIVPVVLLT